MSRILLINRCKMNEKVEKLISDFKTRGWNTPNLYERFFEFADHPQCVYEFCVCFVNNFDHATTLFDDALSYIKRDDFLELIELSINIMKQKTNENAEAVISYASLQYPDLLHDHLEQIFELGINQSTYYAEYPWRNLSSEKAIMYREKLQSDETTVSDKQRLFRCLLETRDLETVRFAYQFALDTNMFDDMDFLIYYLEAVGFTFKNGKIETYCPNPTSHFCFQKHYFPDDLPDHINKEHHPTWNLKPSTESFDFGGLIQDDANNPFIHIITFEKHPNILKIVRLNRLILGVHIRELNEAGALFYQHDEMGRPQKIGYEKQIEIYSDLPIKRAEVSFSETPERWKYQSWGFSNSRENLFRIGGEPTWIQNAEVLTCPKCNLKMDFLMQLDSYLPDVENGEVYFGSGGICYVFWCSTCSVSGYLMQCT